MSSPMPARVSVDEVDSPDATYTLYQDQPFTGVVYEHDSEGRLIDEVDYVDGLRHGALRQFDPENGKLRSETHYQHNQAVLIRDWHPLWEPDDPPVLKREVVIEHGIRVREREWDSNGTLLSEFVLPPDDPSYEILTLRRQRTEA